MDIAQVITRVGEIERGLNSELNDPDALSISIAKLGIAYSVLGNELIECDDRVRQLETQLKFTQSSKIHELVKPKEGKGTPISLAEHIAKVETNNEILEYLKARKDRDLIAIKRSDIKLLVDSLRTRVSFIKGEVK
jgi:hypothetical protein